MAKRRGHGEGSIYRRESDGLWVGSLNIGRVFDPEKGKRVRRRKDVYGKTQAEVREQLARLISDRDRGLVIPLERLTVAQFLERWLRDSIADRKSPATQESYERIVRRHILPMLGETRLEKLTAQDVNALMRDRERSGLAPGTVRQILAVLRMSLKQALSWDLLPRNVASLVEPPRRRPFEGSAMDDDQIARFLTAASDHRLHALFRIAVLLGPRMGELQGLRWADLDLDKSELSIRQTFLRSTGGDFQFGVPKTATSRRSIRMPASCVSALREHRKAQLQERLLAGGKWHDLGLVFTTSIGTPVEDRSLTREYRSVLEAAGVPQMRFHDLRTTAITSMILKGVPPHVVARIVGHSKITMTLSVYAKVFGSTMEEAAAVLDQAFGNQQHADKVSS